MRREFERRGATASYPELRFRASGGLHGLQSGPGREPRGEPLKADQSTTLATTYLVATKDQLGMAKDTMAAKPMVLYESDQLVALASEEVAIEA